MNEDKSTSPLKGNIEKWICKECSTEIELWGKNGFISHCTCIKVDDNLNEVGVLILMKIEGQTELQNKIEKACKGHEVQEVIHAFEVLKLTYLLNQEGAI